MYTMPKSDHQTSRPTWIVYYGVQKLPNLLDITHCQNLFKKVYVSISCKYKCFVKKT